VKAMCVEFGVDARRKCATIRRSGDLGEVVSHVIHYAEVGVGVYDSTVSCASLKGEEDRI
jgi:hypothetical protein